MLDAIKDNYLKPPNIAISVFCATVFPRDIIALQAYGPI